MDLKKAKVLLEKIESLHRSMSMDNGQVTAIERDLMLSYIRQLYEVYLDGKSAAPASAPARSRPEPEPERPKKPRIIEIPDSLKEISEEAPRPEPKPQPRPQPRPEPRVEAPPRPEPRPAPVRKEPKEYQVLFEYRKATELSEKLGERSIGDLTKAFAINDRLLYTNELFGKDQDAFAESLKLLNKFESMDEARSLLVNLAEQYDWTDDERLGTAQDFVKTVRRRYL